MLAYAGNPRTPRQVAFNLLLSYTHTLLEYDTWVHDHECGWGGGKGIRALAKLWKAALALPDKDLGIASEFTRPGVIELLTKFKAKVEGSGDSGEDAMKFKFC